MLGRVSNPNQEPDSIEWQWLPYSKGPFGGLRMVSEVEPLTP